MSHKTGYISIIDEYGLPYERIMVTFSLDPNLFQTRLIVNDGKNIVFKSSRKDRIIHSVRYELGNIDTFYRQIIYAPKRQCLELIGAGIDVN